VQLRVDREAGNRLPPWWYGLAYLEWERDATVFYPLPLNYVVRWWRLARWRWDWWRSRAPRLDRRVRRLVHRAYATGYSAGFLRVQEAMGIRPAKPPLGPRPW
jgi:hypothetical protein